MSDADLSTLLEQEQRLIFPTFDTEVAWALGVRLRAAAVEDELPVAIEIRRSGQCLFHAALPGSAADNDDWLARKAAVVDRYAHSSYYVGCLFRSRGGDFDRDSRLDVARFAAHGGAFPLTVTGAGCVGSVAVSGLPQVEDHAFVVRELGHFLAR